MDASAYLSLKKSQDRHWWFVGRRKVITQVIRRLVALPSNPRILEAGCGYGGNLAMLGKFGDVDAFEFEESARQYASSLANRPVAYGYLPDNAGFDDDRFDLIAMLDVLEHIDDDVGALRTLSQRLDRGGSILLTIPAFPWLWSQHDEIHHHKRRYTKASLAAALRKAGLEPVNMSYFNTLLFPLAIVQRLALRLRGKKLGLDDAPPGFLNTLFAKIFGLESHLVGRVTLPVGLSLFVVARPKQD